MKLLITLDFPPEFGGIQNYLYQIVKHTYSSNDIVLTCGKKSNNDKHLPATIIRVPKFIYKKLSLIFIVPLLFKFLKKDNIKIEAGNIYAALAPWFLNIFFKIKYDVYTYGTELLPLKKHTVKNILLKSTLNKAETIYTLLENQKELLKPLTANKNIKSIPPKIEIKNKWEKRMQNRNNKIEILSVGRLVNHKGHDILIKALKEMVLDFKLTIVGDGPEYKKLILLIKKYELSEKVKILRGLEDNQLQNIYKQSDIFILPSLELNSGREGFGIALLEAMSYSLPIIASNSGGISEVLGNGKYGILVTPGDPKSIKESIVRLKKDLKLQNDLTNRAYNHLLENYAW